MTLRLASPLAFTSPSPRLGSPRAAPLPLRSVRTKCILNSGTIFATPHVFRRLASNLTQDCPLTSDVFHGRDQITLNWLEYTGNAPAPGPLARAPAPPLPPALAARSHMPSWLVRPSPTGKLADVTRTIQVRGRGIVNTMRYIPPGTRAAYRRSNPDPEWPTQLPLYCVLM